MVENELKYERGRTFDLDDYGSRSGLSLVGDRYFSKEDVSPYDQLKWTESDVPIVNDEGQILFIQKGVQFPESWSGLARKVVSSRYFYGEKNTQERESSARQLIGRVTETFGAWSLKQGYAKTQEEADVFRDELAYLAVNQAFAWNSPVWFNVGTDRYENFPADQQRDGFIINSDGEPIRRPLGMNNEYPQTSACFIQSVDDTMEDIMDLATREAMLFRHGSGTGTNLSSLRSSREKISGGGVPSGPLAYLAFFDKVAGIVKSGGRNRRAAKWNGLDADHPDIFEWIQAKKHEQEKLNGLMDFLGISYRDAADSVLYQNENLTVRLTDENMKAIVEGGKIKTVPVHSMEMVDEMPIYDAQMLWEEIAKCSWACADPGLQFHTTINDWHTTPNTAPIRASNPCSEYMHVDNSSCNLASVKLMYFMNEDGTFKVKDFRKALDLIAKSQDLEFDASSFPTPQIARNTHRLRNLGTGYTDLGSLLMFSGLPYDSDEGRATAAAITALMTGQVYLSSTEMAEKTGAFKEYEKNKEPTLRVLRKHRDALKGIERDKIPKSLESIFIEAEKVWDSVVERAEIYGIKNAQATVLAPTGTISFQMDADSTGIEPDLGLVKYKLLAESGVLRIVNKMVPIALGRLGYDSEEIKSIVEHIAGHENIDGAPYLKKEHRNIVVEHKSLGNLDDKLRELGYSKNEIRDISFYVMGHQTAEGSLVKEEHLAVFDCASKPSHATRYISPQGHIKMMAATQPFISGAISKTVNLPKEATVEDIKRFHMDSWEMGLKAVALYRQGCKRGEPLSFGKNNFKNEEAMIEVLRKRGIKLEDHLEPVRRKLPTTRDAKVHHFDLAGHDGYITVGLTEDGSVGETFLTMNKEGSTIRGLLDSLGIAISMGLQYGVPPEDYLRKFIHQKFEPNGMVRAGHPDIHTADSIIDYVWKYIGMQFLGIKDTPLELEFSDALEEPTVIVGGNGNGQEQVVKKKNGKIGEDEELGGICTVCGSQMIKKGHCREICRKCAHVELSGCGG